MDQPSKLQTAPLVVIEVNQDLAITGWNGRAEQVFNKSAAEVVGRELAQILALANDAAGWSTLLDDDDEATTPRLWPVSRDGELCVLEAWSQRSRDAAGKLVSVTLYGHDVTARVAAERQAAMEATMLAAIKDNLDLVMWAVDEQGLFLYQDGKALRPVGLTPHQFVGQSIFELYKDTADNESVARALAGESMRTQAAEVHGIFWDTWYIPLAENPSTARLVGITLDVSESKRSELELRAKLELIERQQQVIRELATPIIEVWDGVLTMPIVGLVDTARASEIMDSLLQAVTETRAIFAILDLTGVEVVDTGTASHLIKMIQAIRLLGAEGILTGIHPTIAQTIVALGVELSHVTVHAKLRDALKYCIRANRRTTRQPNGPARL